MALHIFPGKFVFSHTNKKHKALKQQLQQLIEDDAKDPQRLTTSYGSKLITNYFEQNSHELLQNPLLIESIWEAVDVMLSQIRLNNKVGKSVLTKMWYNIFNKGYSQQIHQHCGSEFSGIYILNSTQPNQTTFFNDENHLLLNQTIQSNFAQEGDFIIFPSSLTHLVPTIEEDNRITIAFNISCVA